jgi:hypothetical protein
VWQNLPTERIVPSVLMPFIQSVDMPQLQLQLEFEEIRQRNPPTPRQLSATTRAATSSVPIQNQSSNTEPIVAPPATPRTNKGLLSRLWEKISTPARGYSRVATASPPTERTSARKTQSQKQQQPEYMGAAPAVSAVATGASNAAASALSARAKRKRNSEEPTEHAVSQQDVVSPVGTPMRRLVTAFDKVSSVPSPLDSPEFITDSPAKRRKAFEDHDGAFASHLRVPNDRLLTV